MNLSTEIDTKKIEYETLRGTHSKISNQPQIGYFNYVNINTIVLYDLFNINFIL